MKTFGSLLALAVFLGVFSNLRIVQNSPRQLTPEEMRKLNQDSKSYIAILENPQRDAEQRPDEVIKALDLKEKELPVGPPTEMRVAREDVIRQIESKGFKLSQEQTFLPYQYFLIFRPQ
jgi:hypothetical protein